jgi:hypothetical protein
MSMKNSNDTIGNRTRDFPACSAVPQPTASPRKILPIFHFVKNNGISKIKICIVMICIFIVGPMFMYSYCDVYVFLFLYLCILNVMFLYSYCYVYVSLCLCFCILIVMFMYSYCYVYVSLFLCFCILIFMFMYSYCYVYVFLLLRLFRSRYSVSLCCSVHC